jgi:nucleoid-associated protein YgaU
MAINRYEFTKVETGTRKKKTYRTTKLPKIPKSYYDRYIFTRAQDRLDLLANEFYGDPRHWIILALANNLGKGTLIVAPGTQLRIPPKTILTEIREILDQTQKER